MIIAGILIVLAWLIYLFRSTLHELIYISLMTDAYSYIFTIFILIIIQIIISGGELKTDISVNLNDVLISMFLVSTGLSLVIVPGFDVFRLQLRTLSFIMLAWGFIILLIGCRNLRILKYILISSLIIVPLPIELMDQFIIPISAAIYKLAAYLIGIPKAYLGIDFQECYSNVNNYLALGYVNTNFGLVNPLVFIALLPTVAEFMKYSICNRFKRLTAFLISIFATITITILLNIAKASITLYSIYYFNGVNTITKLFTNFPPGLLGVIASLIVFSILLRYINPTILYIKISSLVKAAIEFKRTIPIIPLVIILIIFTLYMVSPVATVSYERYKVKPLSLETISSNNFIPLLNGWKIIIDKKLEYRESPFNPVYFRVLNISNGSQTLTLYIEAAKFRSSLNIWESNIIYRGYNLDGYHLNRKLIHDIESSIVFLKFSKGRNQVYTAYWIGYIPVKMDGKPDYAYIKIGASIKTQVDKDSWVILERHLYKWLDIMKVYRVSRVDCVCRYMLYTISVGSLIIFILLQILGRRVEVSMFSNEYIEESQATTDSLR